MMQNQSKSRSKPFRQASACERALLLLLAEDVCCRITTECRLCSWYHAGQPDLSITDIKTPGLIHCGNCSAGTRNAGAGRPVCEGKGCSGTAAATDRPEAAVHSTPQGQDSQTGANHHRHHCQGPWVNADSGAPSTLPSLCCTAEPCRQTAESTPQVCMHWLQASADAVMSSPPCSFTASPMYSADCYACGPVSAGSDVPSWRRALLPSGTGPDSAA